MTTPAIPEPASTPAAPAAPSAPEQPATPLTIAESIQARRDALNAAPPAAPTPTEDPALDPAPEPGPDGQPPAEEGAEPEGGAPAAEPTADAGDVPAEPVKVSLPGRRPGDPDMEITVDDPEVAEALQRQRNGYMRGEEVKVERDALAKERAEQEEFADLVASDPVAFLTQHVPVDIRAETALSLLTDPKVWDLIRDDLPALLESEEKLELARAKLEVRRRDNRDMLRDRSVARTAARQEARTISEALESVIPEGLNEAQGERFVKDALRDLAAYQKRTGAGIQTRDLPLLLADRFEALGVDPTQVAVALARRAAGEQVTRPAGSAPRPAPRLAKAPVPGQAPQVTGKSLVAAQARKVAAAAVPPPGAATPSAAAGPQIPKGANVKEALAAMRARVAAGGHLSTST